MSAVVEEITPAIAEAYLQHNICNRRPNNAMVKYYAEQIKRGNWKLNGEPICFDEKGNLNNGQHRLMAVVLAGEPIMSLVCRNTEEGSFATYDSGKKRSPGEIFDICDILNANRTAAIVRRYNALRSQKSIANSAVGEALRDFTTLSAAEMVELYNQYPDKFQEFGGYAYCLCNKWKLYSPTEVGAMMMYLHIDKGHDELEIYRFFDLLFDYKEHPEFNNGNGMKAITGLREKILRCASNNQKLMGDYKFALLRKAWNCYITGKDCKVLKLAETDEPDFL